MDKEVVIYSSKDEIPAGVELNSILEKQLHELAEVRNPDVHPEQLEEAVRELQKTTTVVYVYYSWRRLAVEMLAEAEFLELKTNRNQLLINKEEQEKLYNHTTVAVAGMSVGSSIVYGLVGSGIAKKLVLADFDSFSTTNLNRVSATVLDVGSNKAITVARRALEMNPFLDITVFTDAISAQNVGDFTNQASVVFEEIDDFKAKLLLREVAKNNATPFVMLTNLGDSVQIDIERYDSGAELFNGLIEPALTEELRSLEKVDSETMKRLSLQLVERSKVPPRALDSLAEIGKTLVGRPQLYGTVALDGGIAPLIVRRLVLDNLESGRYFVDLGEILT